MAASFALFSAKSISFFAPALCSSPFAISVAILVSSGVVPLNTILFTLFSSEGGMTQSLEILDFIARNSSLSALRF
nr:hypothetical protein [uncultured Campylobacter sp.]